MAGVRNDATLYAQDAGFVNNTGTGADGGTSGFIEPSTASNGGDGVVGVHNFGALGAEVNFNGGVASILLGEGNTATAGEGGGALQADGVARIGNLDDGFNSPTSNFERGTLGLVRRRPDRPFGYDRRDPHSRLWRRRLHHGRQRIGCDHRRRGG